MVTASREQGEGGTEKPLTISPLERNGLLIRAKEKKKKEYYEVGWTKEKGGRKKKGGEWHNFGTEGVNILKKENQLQKNPKAQEGRKMGLGLEIRKDLSLFPCWWAPGPRVGGRQSSRDLSIRREKKEEDRKTLQNAKGGRGEGERFSSSQSQRMKVMQPLQKKKKKGNREKREKPCDLERTELSRNAWKKKGNVTDIPLHRERGKKKIPGAVGTPYRER